MTVFARLCAPFAFELALLVCVSGCLPPFPGVTQDMDGSAERLDATMAEGALDAKAEDGDVDASVADARFDAGNVEGASYDGATDTGVVADAVSGVACTFGTPRCNALQPQACDDAGNWQDNDAACAYACSGGLCTGSCVPGSIECSGSQPQACSDASAWEPTGDACAYACSGGACTGTCAAGSAQCNGPQPQTCGDGGVWVDTGASCLICSDGSCITPVQMTEEGPLTAPLLVDATALYATLSGTSAVSINIQTGAVLTGGAFTTLYTQDTNNLYVFEQIPQPVGDPSVGAIAEITKAGMMQYELTLTQGSETYDSLAVFPGNPEELCSQHSQFGGPDDYIEVTCSTLSNSSTTLLDCNDTPGSVCSLTGGPGTLLAADANGVVWNEAIGDTFAVVGPSLTSPRIATLPGNPSVLTIDANYIYWYDSAGTSTFYRTTRVPVNQLFTTGQVLAGTVANAPVQFAVDSNYLYWTDSVAGTVSRVSITSVPATASVLANNQSAPTGIAVDDVSVYWINSGNNTVMKLAKPQ